MVSVLKLEMGRLYPCGSDQMGARGDRLPPKALYRL